MRNEQFSGRGREGIGDLRGQGLVGDAPSGPFAECTLQMRSSGSISCETHSGCNPTLHLSLKNVRWSAPVLK